MAIIARDIEKLSNFAMSSTMSFKALALDNGSQLLLSFDYNTKKINAEILASDGTSDSFFTPVSDALILHDVQALPGGKWMITWSGLDGSTNNYGVHQSVFDASGAIVEPDTVVNTVTAGLQRYGEIAALENGGWVVTFNSWIGTTQSSDIYQQRYDELGNSVGSQVKVNTSAPIMRTGATTISLDGGGWVSVWSDQLEGSGSPNAIALYQQAFDETGAAIGGETKVNTAVAPRFAGSAALGDGKWVVLYEAGYHVYQQIYNADGTPLGQETLVNTIQEKYQQGSQIAHLTGGGWVVVWQSISEGGISQVHQKVFNEDGSVAGQDEVLLTRDGVLNVSFPQVTALDDGNWVITWNGQSSGIRETWQAYCRADEIGQTMVAQMATPGTGVTYALEGGRWATTWRDPTDGVMRMREFRGDDFQTVVYLEQTTEDASILLSDISGGLGPGVTAIKISDIPDTGELKLGGSTVSKNDIIHISDLDNLTWIPDENFHGDVEIGFNRVLPGETELGSPGFWIEVASVNDAPTGKDATRTLLEDTPYFFGEDFGFEDVDGNGFGGIVVRSIPSNGKLTLDGKAVMIGDRIQSEDLDGLSWTPGKNEFGSGLASLKFQVFDDGGTKFGGKNTSSQVYQLTFNVAEVTDHFFGTTRAESLKGTIGGDVFYASSNDDKLTGNGGQDLFHFGNNSDRDTITDFFARKGGEHDTLDLIALTSVDGFTDMKRNHLSKHGLDVWIDGGSGDVLILKGVTMRDLNATDFLF